MARWELETFRARERPVVLTIACAGELAAGCHSAAALVGAIVKEAEAIGAAVTIATQSSPLAIVVPEELLARYTDEFAALAKEVDASLVAIPSQGIAQADLEKLLFDAVVQAARRRGNSGP